MINKMNMIRKRQQLKGGVAINNIIGRLRGGAHHQQKMMIKGGNDN
jgi:hypothetical protein